jgi:hypothetical protein
MQSSLPVGWLAFTGRESNPLDHYKRFQITFSSPSSGLILAQHTLVPKAVRFAVLVNPANATAAETTVRNVQEAARVLGLQILVLKASTSGEIDAAFATLAGERPDALIVASDAFFASRLVQFLAVFDRIPTAYTEREYVEAGGLMSYGTGQGRQTLYRFLIDEMTIIGKRRARSTQQADAAAGGLGFGDGPSLKAAILEQSST